jgi:hypothetical protein
MDVRQQRLPVPLRCSARVDHDDRNVYLASADGAFAAVRHLEPIESPE